VKQAKAETRCAP